MPQNNKTSRVILFNFYDIQNADNINNIKNTSELRTGLTR